MTGLTHYSFDLWLTLIRSNPVFKQERALYFYNNLNFNKKPLDEVVKIFRQVDLMCNHINEKTGKNIDADEMYLMVISMINDSADVVFNIDTDALYAEMEHLLFKNMPVLFCDQTIEVLLHLKQYTAATTNILSNTGFIKGETLRKVLQHIGIDQFIDFQLYSDETGISKPNPNFFKLMINEVQKLYDDNINLQSIVHIGDNPIADLAGAEGAGIKGILINSNNKSIFTIIEDANHLFTS
ncbi:HAD family hydrolase [Mucilaginibacter limnophilus]|uniref:HAD family hydrolase n=1 Tax=Mucilaginibacter limnophilus TaxID=1932778 RepID=A0A437MR44_9SPHI|nr:HAD family hydrolase [Mucilaginibacter limnophilus]RVU00114.1 HAD family hydrolase [Mucilaginibacter limnophilus]